jgi:hypothetical protein
MNHTRIPHLLARHARPVGIALAVFAAMSVWFGGCADPRTQPLQPSAPGYTETVVLWENASSNGDVISATFNVQHELAPIENPTEDTPARLTIVAYVRPDCQILRREEIVTSGIPGIMNTRIIPALIGIDSVRRTLDSLDQLVLNDVEGIQRGYVDSARAVVDSSQFDTTFGSLACDTALYKFVFDTLSPFPDSIWARRDTLLSGLPAIVRTLEDQVVDAQIDTVVLGFERDDLAGIVDNRFNLALWLDPDTTATLPEAVYVTVDHRVAEQRIYLAATDTDTSSISFGYKGRGFELRLNNFSAANPNPEYLGEMREVNWTTCFLGDSTRPCLRPGDHTLRARLTGRDTKVTGTLVLVYERTTP